MMSGAGFYNVLNKNDLMTKIDENTEDIIKVNKKIMLGHKT